MVPTDQAPPVEAPAITFLRACSMILDLDEELEEKRAKVAAEKAANAAKARKVANDESGQEFADYHQEVALDQLNQLPNGASAHALAVALRAAVSANLDPVKVQAVLIGKGFDLDALGAMAKSMQAEIVSA